MRKTFQQFISESLLVGAGLGTALALLSQKSFQALQRRAESEGYVGREGTIKYAKKLLGIKVPEGETDNYNYSPEEKQAIAQRLEGEVAKFKNTPQPDAMMSSRTQEFASRLFDSNKTSMKAVRALDSAIRFNKDEDIKVVLGAIARGGASQEFRTWTKTNVGKPTNRTFSFGRKGKTPFPGADTIKKGDYVSYTPGEQPMSQMTWEAVMKFYRSLYGNPLTFPAGPKQEPASTPLNKAPSPAERAATDHGLNRTAQALRNIASDEQNT